MPAKSKAQQRYFGMLYSKAKSGDLSGLSDKDKKKVKDMGIDKIREYAKTRHTSLPNKVKSAKVAGMIQKVAGYAGVSGESVVTLIKLGYESELIHMENEVTGMEKNAAIGATIKPIVKAMSSKLAPKAMTLAKGSSGILKATTKMAPAIKSGMTAATKAAKPGMFANIGKSLGKMKTPLAWGTGGFIAGSAITGAVKSREGVPPRPRMYG